MGAAPSPVCWDGRRARGFGEPVPSIFIQRRPCPSGIRHPTSSSISTVLLSTAASHQPPLPSRQRPAVMAPTPSSPSLPGARGSHSGHIPPSFCPCQGVFCRLWPPARGKGRGSVSITVGPRQGWRVPTLLPSGSIPRAASHPAWGPGERRREMSRSRGSAREGSVGRNTQKPHVKTLCILRKCQ